MTTNVLRAPQAIGFRARRLMYLAIGLIAAALVVLAIVSSGGSSTTSGTDVRASGPAEAAVGASVAAGRAVFPAHPDEAAVAASVSRSGDESVPAGSGVSMGRTPYVVHEPNLLPK